MSKKIDKLVSQLREIHGAENIMLATEMPDRPMVSSGSLALDFACGGGFPSDRLIEIAGAEGTGKTTLALLAMAKILDANPDRAGMIIDLEHKLDRDWVQMLIGEERASRVLLLPATYIEDATNYFADAVGGNEKKKIEPGQVCCAIIDSIGGAPTVRRNDDATVASFGGNTLGVKDFAILAAALSHKHACLTIGINQIRADMAGYNRHMVPGGKAWLHAVSLRIQLKKGKGTITEKINGEDMTVGYQVVGKVVKSGISAPGRTAWWWFMNVPTEKYGFGVDTIDEVVRLSTLTGVIERKGAWYNHPALPDGKILSLDRLTDFIRADQPLRETLSKQILEQLQTGQFTEVAPASDPEAPIDESIGERWARLEEESGE